MIALVVGFTGMLVTTAAIILVFKLLQIDISEGIASVLGLVAGFFVIGPWATHRIFESVNWRLPPRYKLHLQKRPIPDEHRRFRDGDEIDVRWEKGWRYWLIIALVVAIGVYIVFFSDPTP
jgi:hypothetical protein